MDNNVFSYTHRSFEDARQEGISKIPIISRGDWTDLNSSDPGIIILDYVHALVDMVQFYQDHNALEAFLSTAKERKNIFRLAKQLGYTIRSAKGSLCDVTFNYDNVDGNHTILIPKNTIVSTGYPTRIPYYTAVDSYIHPGEVEVTVPCVQGELHEYSYIGTGISSLDDGNSRDQSVLLTTLGIDTETISITDNKSNIWKNVTDVIFSDSGSKEFSVLLQPDGNVTVLFGNDERGYTPKETDVLSIRYYASLGSSGKVGANTINIIVSDIYDDRGNLVNGITVNNYNPSSGGSDPEDSQTIRRNSPAVIKAQDRAVTRKDYEALAKQVAGVKDAKAYDINNSPKMPFYEVKVLIIPESGIYSESLRLAVFNHLYNKCTPPTVISVVGPSYKTIDIECSIIKSSNYTDESVIYNVRKSLETYLASFSTIIGAEINPNTIISVISKSEGVLYLSELNKPQDIVYLKTMETSETNEAEIPVLGNVVINIVGKG